MTLDIYSQLKRCHYATVPFHTPKDLIPDSVQSFFDFLKLSEKTRSVIDFKLNPDHRRGDIGYKRRKEEEGIYNDEKEFFHFHPRIFELYSDLISNEPVVAQFLQNANTIWCLAEAKLKEILKGLEDIYPDAHDRLFHKGDSKLIIRFLKYEWHTSGKYLAKPHFDAGALTIAVAEDCPGLRIGSNPDNLVLIPQHPDQGVFFLSSNYLNVFTDAHDLKPGWHDVIQVDDQLVGKPFARWAIVAFIEPYFVDAPPREETHKWYKHETSMQENIP